MLFFVRSRVGGRRGGGGGGLFVVLYGIIERYILNNLGTVIFMISKQATQNVPAAVIWRLNHHSTTK